MKIVCGYLQDKEKLKQSTSGGIAYKKKKKIIENGGIVYGVAYTDDFRSAQYIKTESVKELDRISGTKYIRAKQQLPGGIDVKKDIFDMLLGGHIVLCIGLPCFIYSVKQYVKEEGYTGEGLFTIDLICHGPAYNEMHEEFINILEKKYSSRIISYNVRYKNPDWKPAYIKAEFENGQSYLMKLNDSAFGKAFNICPQPCAYKCSFKENNRASDITIGDFWGITEKDKSFNPKGVSVAFLHTERSEWLVDNEDFLLFEADEVIALSGNPRYSTSLEKNEDADRFIKLYKLKGLEYACEHYLSITTRIKRKIKKILRR